MIRNTDTCGAYAIRPYPDGRKELYLRSIWDYAKCIDLLFESRNGYAKWHDIFFDPKNGYEK